MDGMYIQAFSKIASKNGCGTYATIVVGCTRLSLARPVNKFDLPQRRVAIRVSCKNGGTPHIFSPSRYTKNLMLKGCSGVIENGMLPALMNLHIIIEDQSTTQENYVDDNITSLALGTSCGLFHVRICPTGPFGQL
jgi:hypothetical protein